MSFSVVILQLDPIKAQERREKSQKVKKRKSEEKEMMNGAQIIEESTKKREQQIKEVKRLAMAEGIWLNKLWFITCLSWFYDTFVLFS